MSCGIADIQLWFEVSGVGVEPIEVNSYENLSKFDHARIRVTREAGLLIADKHKANEPVFLSSNGEKIKRFYIPDTEQAINLTEDDCYIRLYDQLKFLKERNVNKTYTGSYSYAEIVDDLFEKAKEIDDHNVLNSWIPPEQNNLQADTSFSLGNLRNFAGLQGRDENVAFTTEAQITGGIPVLGNVVGSALEVWANNSWSIFDGDTGMDFEDVSVFDALQKITNQLEEYLYIDNSGNLYIGGPHHEPGLFIGGQSKDTANLINVSTALDGQQIKRVVVRGGIAGNDYTVGESGDIDDGGEPMRHEAVAVRTDIEHGKTIYKDPVNQDTPDALMFLAGEELEQIAAKGLVNSVYDSNSGNLGIDVLSSSTELSNIKNIQAGDYFFLNEFDNCRIDIPAQMFLTTKVHHKLNSRDGWVTNLSITEVANQEKIGTSSYLVDITNEDFLQEEPNESGGQEIPDLSLNL